jgi:hypothetical protein
MMNRRFLTVLLLGGAAFAASPVEPVNQKSGLAVKGHDPVAYFTEGRPVKGNPQVFFDWMGARWVFASAANRDLFAASPEKYAPQFGGYCAWAVSNNYTAGIDPEAWKIVDGKLYLNYSKSVQRKWEQELDKRIADANRNWPGLHK